MLNETNLEIVLINRSNNFHYNYRLYFTIRYFLSSDITIKIIDTFSYNNKYDKMFIDLRNFDKNVIYEKLESSFSLGLIMNKAINDSGKDYILFISEDLFLKSFGLFDVLNRNIEDNFHSLSSFINNNLDKNFLLINKSEYLNHLQFNISETPFSQTIENLKQKEQLNKIINFDKGLFVDNNVITSFYNKQTLEIVNDNDKKKL
jgi:hypothetical protein